MHDFVHKLHSENIYEQNSETHIHVWIGTFILNEKEFTTLNDMKVS